MRVLILAEGSEGDIRPAVALALKLMEKGHDIKALVTQDYIPLFHQRGIQAEPLSIQSEAFFLENSKRIFRGFWGYYSSISRFIKGMIKTQGEAVYRYGRNYDVIYATGFIFGAQSAAEALGIPLLHSTYSGVFFPSKEVPLPGSSLLNLPPLFNSLSWRILETILSRLIKRPVNKLRISWNLSPLKRIKHHFLENLVLAMDQEIQDYPLEYRKKKPFQPSYPILLEEAPVDPDILAFIQEGPPPVYVGFGSMIEKSRNREKGMLSQIEQTSCRIIYASGGFKEVAPRRISKNIMLLNRCPHHLIFPMLAGVVHHGGAGIIHTCAHSGVPQVGCPHMLDQFYLSQSIHRRGLGPAPVSRAGLKGDGLTRLISSLYYSKEYRKPCEELALRIRSRDGAAEILNLLEKAIP